MEEWRDIKGFEGKYQISSLGRVKSLPRGKVKKERILALGKHNRGYCIAKLFDAGKTNYLLVHRLVAIAFIPNPNNLDTVDHINEDKKNNTVDNLKWMTNLDNWKKSNMGEDNPKSKMTKEKVREMRSLYVSGATQKELVEKFNLSRSQVSVILSKKFWKDA